MMANQAGLGLGDTVHTQEINEYPENLKQEYLHLSVWIKALTNHYGRQIVVRVIDPQSLVGLWKHIRYRIRRYPTILVEGSDKFTGWEQESALHTCIREILNERGLPSPTGEFSILPHVNPFQVQNTDRERHQP